MCRELVPISIAANLIMVELQFDGPLSSTPSIPIMTVSGRRQDLIRSRLGTFTRTLHGVSTGDVKAVHRTRVATRRIRELLPLLGLKSLAASKLERRLRKLTRRLGAVRELDVLLLLIK